MSLASNLRVAVGLFQRCQRPSLVSVVLGLEKLVMGKEVDCHLGQGQWPSEWQRKQWQCKRRRLTSSNLSYSLESLRARERRGICRRSQLHKMDTSRVTSRIDRLIKAIVPHSDKLQNLCANQHSFSLAEMSSALHGFSDSLRNLESFLLPAFSTSTSGMRFTSAECCAIADALAVTGLHTLPILMLNILGCLDRDEMILGEITEHGSAAAQAPSSATSAPQSFINSCPASSVSNFKASGDTRTLTDSLSDPFLADSSYYPQLSSIMLHILALVQFTLVHSNDGQSDFLGRLLQAECFPNSCSILLLCTKRFKTPATSSLPQPSTQEDQQRVTLCGALLGCTVGEFCRAVYGAVRNHSDITAAPTNGGGPSKREVWAQLQDNICSSTLIRITELLVNAARDGNFYQQQSPMHQSLLTPTLGLEHLVSSSNT